MLPEAVLLKDGIYWGGDFEAICELGEQGKLHERNSRFFIGYSGWGAGQLEQELLQNSWIISRGGINTIFDADPSYLWRSILKEMGGRYKVFANFPEDPRLN
jgi:putative transcriptional regulator